MLTNPNEKGTIIDKILNHYRNEVPDPALYEDISKAIGLIFAVCLGFKRKDNGFWDGPREKPKKQERRREEGASEHEYLPDDEGGIPAGFYNDFMRVSDFGEDVEERDPR